MGEDSDHRPDLLIKKKDGLQYWQSITADEDGMLGGIPKQVPNLSKIDLQGSREFLAKLGIGKNKGQKDISRALEGGAGIGRVTKGFLTSIAETVDIIEPISKFTQALQNESGVNSIINVGLEDWRPGPSALYSLFWIQWCLGHLRDDQIIEFLRKAGAALSPGGFVVIKENITSSGKDEFDATDSTVTRQDEKFRDLFDKAGLKIVETDIQTGFPEFLYKVRMYALTKV